MEAIWGVHILFLTGLALKKGGFKTLSFYHIRNSHAIGDAWQLHGVWMLNTDGHFFRHFFVRVRILALVIWPFCNMKNYILYELPPAISFGHCIYHFHLTLFSRRLKTPFLFTLPPSMDHNVRIIQSRPLFFFPKCSHKIQKTAGTTFSPFTVAMGMENLQ